jgi:hypothetical protein
MAGLPDDALAALSGALQMLEVRIGEVAARTEHVPATTGR